MKLLSELLEQILMLYELCLLFHIVKNFVYKCDNVIMTISPTAKLYSITVSCIVIPAGQFITYPALSYCSTIAGVHRFNCP